MTRRMLRTLALVAAVAPAACGDNTHVVFVDARDQLDGPTEGDAAPAATFTRFVHDQIAATSDTTAPVPFAVFQVLPDPDLDDDDYSAYADLFP